MYFLKIFTCNLAKNLCNFVSLPWKLDNLYYHILHQKLNPFLLGFIHIGHYLLWLAVFATFYTTDRFQAVYSISQFFFLSGFIHIGVFWPLFTMVGCFRNILHHRLIIFRKSLLYTYHFQKK